MEGALNPADSAAHSTQTTGGEAGLGYRNNDTVVFGVGRGGTLAGRLLWGARKAVERVLTPCVRVEEGLGMEYVSDEAFLHRIHEI